MVRQIRGKPESIRSSVQLVSLSNALPKSEDKTEGFARRLDWYEVDNKLIKSDEWFERLFSEESTQYLIMNKMRSDKDNKVLSSGLIRADFSDQASLIT